MKNPNLEPITFDLESLAELAPLVDLAEQEGRHVLIYRGREYSTKYARALITVLSPRMLDSEGA